MQPYCSDKPPAERWHNPEEAHGCLTPSDKLFAVRIFSFDPRGGCIQICLWIAGLVGLQLLPLFLALNLDLFSQVDYFFRDFLTPGMRPTVLHCNTPFDTLDGFPSCSPQYQRSRKNKLLWIFFSQVILSEGAIFLAAHDDITTALVFWHLRADCIVARASNCDIL